MGNEKITACQCGLPAAARRLMEEQANFETALWAAKLCAPQSGYCCIRQLVVKRLHAA